MKKKIMIFVSIMLLLLAMSAYVMPYFKPFTIKDIQSGCVYKVYGTYAAFISAAGVVEDEVEIANSIWGRNVVRIEKYAFSNDKCRIRTVIIPDTIETIESYAFIENETIEKIVFGKNVKKVGSYAFDTCSNLTDVEMNQGLKVIDKFAYVRCENLKRILLPDSVEYIGNSAFKRTALQDITFPKMIVDLGTGIMLDTPWEKECPTDVIHNGYYLNCKNDKENIVVIPNGVRYVASKFSENTEEIYINSGVEVLGNGLIYNAYVDTKCTFYIPSSVKRISTGDQYSEECHTEMVADISKIKIVTTEGSYAEQYAIEKGIAYEIVDDVQALYDAALERQKAGQE